MILNIIKITRIDNTTKTAALAKSLISFISSSFALVILSHNFSIEVFKISNANNKK